MNTTTKTISPPTLEDAIALAKKAHDGQTDKAGAPYFGHLERVMNSVEGEDLKIIAVLHDSIEDTDETTPINVTREYLQNADYPEHIIIAIEGVTKRPDEENSDAGYLRFVQRAGQNPLSRAVKMADLRDNMDLSRIGKPTEKDCQRIAKYQRALAVLEAM
jgi:(p)ppGpp synthase/HD superfamily hydrolase